jgi:hypothetical protein
LLHRLCRFIGSGKHLHDRRHSEREVVRQRNY